MNRNLDLFLTFTRISATCFGGGYAMLPFFQREIVEKRGWSTESEMGDIYAIAQCTPGVISVNTATFIGYKISGFPGALCATLGVLFPPLVIITLIAAFFWQFSHVVWIQHALAGIRACICALILKSVIQLFRSAVIDWPAALLFTASLLLAAIWGLSPVILVVTSGIIGLALFQVRKKRGRS